MSLITLPAFLTRRREDNPMPETETIEPQPEKAIDVPLMRFLTQGGATIELRRHQFRTRYTWQGRPYVSDEVRTVDGFRWKCLGCDKLGGPGFFDTDYLPDEADRARGDANEHADTCRAMPKTEA